MKVKLSFSLELLLLLGCLATTQSQTAPETNATAGPETTTPAILETTAQAALETTTQAVLQITTPSGPEITTQAVPETTTLVGTETTAQVVPEITTKAALETSTPAILETTTPAGQDITTQAVPETTTLVEPGTTAPVAPETTATTEVNPCMLNPCENDGKCSIVVGGEPPFYDCTCVNGYTGVNCTEDVDECTDAATICEDVKKNSTCVNTYGSFTCVCQEGLVDEGGECKVCPNNCPTGEISQTCEFDSNTCSCNCNCNIGYVENNGICVEGESFFGKMILNINTTTADEGAMKNYTYDLLTEIYTNPKPQQITILGYNLPPSRAVSSAEVPYTLVFTNKDSINADIIEDTFKTGIEAAQKKVSAPSSVDVSVDVDKSLPITEPNDKDLCDSDLAIECDTVSSTCAAHPPSVSTYCKCNEGFYQSDYSSTECLAQFCTENTACNAPFGICGGDETDIRFCECIWGFNGDNCKDPWLFVFTILTGFFGLSLIIAVAVGFACAGKKQKGAASPPAKTGVIDTASTADDESSVDEDYVEYNNSKGMRANYDSYGNTGYANKALDDYDEQRDNYGRTRNDVSVYAPYPQPKKPKKQKQPRKDVSRERSQKENRRVSTYDSSPYNPGVLNVKPERPTNYNNSYYDVDNMYSRSDNYQKSSKKQKKAILTDARDSYIEMDDVYQDQAARRQQQQPRGYPKRQGYYYE